MATYISDANLTIALEALLNELGASLPDKYNDSIVGDANQNAHDQIISILAGRGYTKSQIDTWVQRVEFNRDLALYWCCVKASGLDAVDESQTATFTRLDRRAELATITLLDSSYAYIAPAGLTPPVVADVVSYGDMANDSALRPDTFRNPTTGEWKKW